jgi:hypothetical protein
MHELTSLPLAGRGNIASAAIADAAIEKGSPLQGETLETVPLTAGECEVDRRL